jgi:hypothetical protein
LLSPALGRHQVARLLDVPDTEALMMLEGMSHESGHHAHPPHHGADSGHQGEVSAVTGREKLRRRDAR